MDVIHNAAHSKTFAVIISDNRREICIEVGTNSRIQDWRTIFRAEHNMDKEKTQRSSHGEDYRSDLRPSRSTFTRTWGFAPRWNIAAPPALLLCATAISIIITSLLTGCKSETPRIVEIKTPEYPTRPTTPPPPFKLFHQTNNSITLVTDPNASDHQIEAIIYQLHDAAQTHTFDHLHIPQKLVDARDPFLFFHIYRGPKCAPEKYASGDLPCGNSYHAAGDYTLGDFKDPNRDSGLLRNPDTQQETPLWP